MRQFFQPIYLAVPVALTIGVLAASSIDHVVKPSDVESADVTDLRALHKARIEKRLSNKLLDNAKAPDGETKPNIHIKIQESDTPTLKTKRP